MRFLRAMPLVVAMLLTAACATRPQLPERGGFVAREISIDGSKHQYQVFVPSRRAVSGRPAVILFLHGSGERGDDNRRQITVGLGPVVQARSDTFPAIVVFPQAPEGSEWQQIETMVLAQLDAATAEFGGDPDRTYLTGLSMGGYGTWDYALHAPGRFAALVPVCGGLLHPGRPSMAVRGLGREPDPYAAVAQRLAQVPLWIFHGAKDDVVPAGYSRRLHAALEAAGAGDARYTEFPDANHNSWDAAYAQTPALWDWLFAQKRR